MTYILFAVICLLLLLFIKQAMELLHPLITVIISVLLLYFVLYRQALPLLKQLKSLFIEVPFSAELLASIFVLLIAQFIKELLLEFEYKSMALLVEISAGFFLLSIWLKEFYPFISVLQELVTSLNGGT